jgi:hypothetical protein
MGHAWDMEDKDLPGEAADAPAADYGMRCMLSTVRRRACDE